MPRILVIGGSDSSGGAGVFADAKTCYDLGCEVSVAVTAVTAQNARKHYHSQVLAKQTLQSQLFALSDFRIDAVKIGAKDLVRTRNFIKKFIKMESQMNTVSMQLQMMKSTEAMNSAMKGVTKAMVRMNKQIKLPKVRFQLLSLTNSHTTTPIHDNNRCKS